MPKAKKDFMRNRVYEAEAKWAVDHPDDVQPPLNLESFGRRVVTKKAFKNLIAPRSCSVVHVEHRAYRCVPEIFVSGSERWTIKVPGQTTRMDVLHSMAHGIQNVFMLQGGYWPGGQIHDPEFVKLYLALVRRFYMPYTDEAVKSEFKKYLIAAKVKTSTRNLSPEAQEAASNRLREAVHTPRIHNELTEMLEGLQKLRGGQDGDD